MARVAIDLVPTLAQPERVSEAIAETTALRDRVREAAELTAAAQAGLDEAEREDVEAAAQRARAGQALGTAPPNVSKLRAGLEARKRDHSALTLALKLAEEDLAQTLAESADSWVGSLDQSTEKARQRALEALAVFEAACAEIGTAASVEAWVRSGSSDGRWDRRQKQMLVGARAPSSRRLTANSEPLDREQVIAFAHELIESPEPPSPAPAMLLVESPVDAA